jgi:hypothetical protein
MLITTLNTPPLMPQINRPRHRVNNDCTIVKRVPIKMKHSNIKIARLRPEPSTLPAIKLPMASPMIEIELTIVL